MTDLIVATPCPPSVVLVSSNLLVSIDRMVRELGDLPEISSQATLNAVHDVVVRAHQMLNLIEAERQRLKRPFLDVGRQLDAAAAPVKARLQAIIDEGKSQEETFLIAQEQARQAAEAERRRLEAEALAAQQAAAAAGQPARPTPALPPAAPIPPPVEARLQTFRRVEIVDASLLPREFLMPDMTKIRAAALAGRGIPGVAVLEEKQVVAR